jgi:antirestriction protein ArdC
MREGHPTRPFAEALAPAPAGVATSDIELTALPPRHREALAKLEQGYAMACSHEGFRQYLRVVSHLYAYSPRNVMLIFAQMPEATMVNSYERWQAANRQVRKGERGLKIFYPQHRLVPREDDDGVEERRRVLTGFGIGNVFDVSQTDGPPLAPPTPPDERFATTDVAGALTDRLASFLIGEGLRVEQKPLPKVRGYFDPDKREVALNAALPRDDGWLKTLGHETAHYLAGDTAGWEGRPLREFVAEASAYAALLAMGVDTSGYSLDYIKWWTREPGMVKTAMPEIAVVTKRLIAIMEGERPEAMGEWL